MSFSFSDLDSEDEIKFTPDPTSRQEPQQPQPDRPTTSGEISLPPPAS